MNGNDWTVIPARLKDAGFAVSYVRVSYDPDRPLWSAKASRAGQEWSSMGDSLGVAFLELERQTLQDGGDWRKIIAHEVLRSHIITGAA
jgi:hypothetical protein